MSGRASTPPEDIVDCISAAPLPRRALLVRVPGQSVSRRGLPPILRVGPPTPAVRGPVLAHLRPQTLYCHCRKCSSGRTYSKVSFNDVQIK